MSLEPGQRDRSRLRRARAALEEAAWQLCHLETLSPITILLGVTAARDAVALLEQQLAQEGEG
jgi:hypothetical protein